MTFTIDIPLLSNRQVLILGYVISSYLLGFLLLRWDQVATHRRNGCPEKHTETEQVEAGIALVLAPVWAYLVLAALTIFWLGMVFGGSICGLLRALGRSIQR